MIRFYILGMHRMSVANFHPVQANARKCDVPQIWVRNLCYYSPQVVLLSFSPIVGSYVGHVFAAFPYL